MRHANATRRCYDDASCICDRLCRTIREVVNVFLAASLLGDNRVVFGISLRWKLIKSHAARQRESYFDHKIRPTPEVKLRFSICRVPANSAFTP
jgi:hypothetical protein